MKVKVFCTEQGHSVVVLTATFSLAFWKKSFSTQNHKWTVTGTILNQTKKYLGCYSSWTTSTTGIELKLSTNTLTVFDHKAAWHCNNPVSTYPEATTTGRCATVSVKNCSSRTKHNVLERLSLLVHLYNDVFVKIIQLTFTLKFSSYLFLIVWLKVCRGCLKCLSP